MKMPKRTESQDNIAYCKYCRRICAPSTEKHKHESICNQNPKKQKSL